MIQHSKFAELTQKKRSTSLFGGGPFTVPENLGVALNPNAAPDEKIAAAAGRTVSGDIADSNIFLRMLNELIRPQKALFATLYSLRTGNDIKTALEEGFDELTATGFLSGKFKRDVQFSDIIKPFSAPQDRSFALKAAGLVGDFFLDPTIALSKVGATRKAFDLIGLAGSKTLQLAENIPGLGKLVEKSAKVFKEAFIVDHAETSLGRGAELVKRKAAALFDRFKSDIIQQRVADAKIIKAAAKEAGFKSEEFLQELLRIAVKNRTGEDLFALKSGLSLGEELTKKGFGSDVVQAIEKRFGSLDALNNRLFSETEANFLLQHGVAVTQKAFDLGVVQNKYVESATKFTDLLDQMNLRDLTKTIDLTVKEATESIGDYRPYIKEIVSRNFDALIEKAGAQVRPELRQQVVDLITDIRTDTVVRPVVEAGARIKAAKKFGTRKDQLDEIVLPLRRALLEDYFHLALTNEARKVFQQHPEVWGNVQRMGFELTPNHAAVLSRNIQTVDDALELNAKAMRGELVLTLENGQVLDLKGIKFQMLETNPLLLDSIRTFYTHKTITNLNLLDKFISKTPHLIIDDNLLKKIESGKKIINPATGEPIRRIDQYLAMLGKEDFVNLTIPGFKSVFLPKEPAEILSRHFQFSRDQDLTSRLIKAIGDVNSVWKIWTLLPFSEFHIRNLVSNQWAKTLAGMKPHEIPQYSLLASSVVGEMLPESALTDRIVEAMSKAGKALSSKIVDGMFVTQAGTKIPLEQIAKEMLERGILRSGQFGSAEMIRSIKTAIDAEVGTLSIVKRVTSVDANPVLRNMANMGAALEDLDRASLFLWELDRGASFDQAMDSVFKFLFDYNDLTDFEKNIRKFVAPFYTWTRKNIPLQLEFLVKDPQKFSALLKIKKNLETDVKAGKAPDDAFISEYIRDGFGIRIQRKDSGEYEYFILNNWIPAADLTELNPSRLKELIVGNLGPIPSTIISQLTDEYLFFDRDFSSVRRNIFAGVRLTDRQTQLVRNLRVLTFIDRVVKEMEEDRSIGLKLLSIFAGLRTFRQNTRLGRKRAIFEKQQKRGEIRAQLRRELREPKQDILEKFGLRKPEVERLREELQKLRAEKF